MRERRVQDSRVGITHLFESFMKRVMDAPEETGVGDVSFAFGALIKADFGGKQIADHGRYERSREQVGRRHGEDNGECQRSEQEFSSASEKYDGHKHDADAQRGD